MNMICNTACFSTAVAGCLLHTALAARATDTGDD